MKMAAVASSSVAGKARADIVQHRLRGQDRGAEIALQDIADVADELLPERQVQPHLDPHPLIRLGVGAVADGGQNRIDRHDAADQERHQQQAQERQGDGQQEPGDTLERPRRTAGPGGGVVPPLFRISVNAGYFFDASR